MHLPITLQINVAPSDHWHLGPSLAHHVRTWGAQVDELLLTVETLRSSGPRGAEWEQGKSKVDAVISNANTQHPCVRAVDVDYSDAASAQVSAEFFGGARIPLKDCFGAPFYSYLYGLHAARNALVLHLDSDMLFGGGSQTWLVEAVAALRDRHDVLVAAPLPGPPSADGAVPPKIAARHHRTQRYGSRPIAQQTSALAYGFQHMSTRVFLIDRLRFKTDLVSLAPIRLRRLTYPRGLGHPPFFPLETVFSRAMRRRRLIRLNMLGSEPGMWYVHPPQRQPGLEQALPQLIDRVEVGDIPAEQLGDDQMNESMYVEPAADNQLPPTQRAPDGNRSYL